jgi:hypothetical protein
MPSKPISCNSSGNNTLLAGATGKKIRVFSYTIRADAAVNVKFRTFDVDGSTPIEFTGSMAIANAGDPHSAPCDFICTIAQPFLANLSSGVAINGHFEYEYVG